MFHLKNNFFSLMLINKSKISVIFYFSCIDL